MICPVCRNAKCRRSRRHGIRDFALSAIGMRPWRCGTCEKRFHAWVVPPVFLLNVHCPRCGNMVLERVAAKRVEKGAFLGLRRLLNVPAYRCDPCRHKFFSLRPYRPVTLARESDAGPPGGSAPPASS